MHFLKYSTIFAVIPIGFRREEDNFRPTGVEFVERTPSDCLGKDVCDLK